MKMNDGSSFTPAIALRAMFRTGGLRNFQFYLLDLVRTRVDIVRVTSVLCSNNGRHVMSLADTNSVSVLNIHSVGDHPSPFVHSERLHDAFYINDLSYLQTGAAHSIADWRDRPFLHHKSMLRIPLFETEDYVFIIIFWSDVRGVFDDHDLEFLANLLNPLVDDFREQLADIGRYGDRISQVGVFGHDICCTPGLDAALKDAEGFAKTDWPILILGETGVGKEMLVNVIVEKSKRASKPFVRLNCGAISPGLIDNELFGHEKGAFTGAITTHYGLFEQADGGTIFLDEVGDMNEATQIRLLRALDSGVIRRVGGAREIKTNVRLLAAAHDDIHDRVKDGRFRKDLWYRISVMDISIPPLRARPNDIPVLIQYFIDRHMEDVGLTWKPSVSGREMKKLQEYPWPGNVRELMHTVKRALARASIRKSSVLDFELKSIGTSYPQVQLLDSAQIETGSAVTEKAQEWITLREHEDHYIKRVVQHCAGKLTGPNSACAILGMHYATLRKRLRKMDAV